MKALKNLKARIFMGLTTAAKKTAEKALALKDDNRGVDIVVMVVVLAILIGIAIIFRTQITKFVNDLFARILAF